MNYVFHEIKNFHGQSPVFVFFPCFYFYFLKEKHSIFVHTLQNIRDSFLLFLRINLHFKKMDKKKHNIDAPRFINMQTHYIIYAARRPL